MNEKQRTLSQNNALHHFLKEVSDEMLNRGIELKQAIPNNIDIPVTPEFLKWIFQRIGKEMFLKEHTSDFTTTELGEVEKVFNRWLVTAFNIDIRFPNFEKD